MHVCVFVHVLQSESLSSQRVLATPALVVPLLKHLVTVEGDGLTAGCRRAFYEVRDDALCQARSNHATFWHPCIGERGGGGAAICWRVQGSKMGFVETTVPMSLRYRARGHQVRCSDGRRSYGACNRPCPLGVWSLSHDPCLEMHRSNFPPA